MLRRSSSLWLTLMVILAALLLSQATAFWLVREYVLKPRIARSGLGPVSELKVLRTALESAVDEPQRQRFIARLAEQDRLQVVPYAGKGNLKVAPDTPAFAAFRGHLREAFGIGAEIYVRTDVPRSPTRPLWILLNLQGRDTWIVLPRRRFDSEPATAILLWSAAGLVIALAASFLIMWKLNRPLSALAKAADDFGNGRDPGTVPSSGPKEIRAVAIAFNEMKNRLQRNERERALFLAGVSHDLRTPLARLGLEVAMLKGRVDPATRQGMSADLDEMNAILAQFIDFARGEMEEAAVTVDLSALARDCAQRWKRTGADVQSELPESAPVQVRPLAMARLVNNLLANAVRHAGGEIVVRLARSDAGQASLSVLDRGPGIPSNMAEYLKEPFTRREEARSGPPGSGLGLAIADRIARLHDGRLDLLPRDGGGLEARVTLPA